METTQVRWNKKIQRIRDDFDRIIAFSSNVPHFTLTSRLYDDYCNAIYPSGKLSLRGNPKYRGIEIKKREFQEIYK